MEMSRSTKNINGAFFKNWTEKSAYVMGLIFADGTLVETKEQLRVSLTSNDYDLLVKINEAMESEYAITQDRNAFKTGFGNPELIETLMEYGLGFRKSDEGRFPKQIPAEFMPHFIRGFFDGDGHFTWERHKGEKKRMVSGFTFGNIELAKGLVDTLREFGLKEANIHYRDRRGSGGRGTYYECRYYTRDTRKLYKLMYEDATIYLKSKKAHYDENAGTY